MDRLLEILGRIRPECNFETAKDFIGEGLLDSFDIMTLVSELEREFNIFIDGEKVTPENFKNLRTLKKFIKEYLDLGNSELVVEKTPRS